MHANMPHGSRPDFIRRAVVESCTSSTFDVAFFIIGNNWILPHNLSLLRTHRHFVRVHSGHAQLIDLLRGGVGVGSQLHQGAFWQPGSELRGVRGDSAGWSGACQ